MTARSQLRQFGISAEAEDDLVIIETERTFMSLTPRELSGFYPHLQDAYRRAQRAARRKDAAGGVV